MSTVDVLNTWWEERLYCPSCDQERPFIVSCEGWEEKAECARCGFSDDRDRFGDDLLEIDYEESSMDGGGWD